MLAYEINTRCWLRELSERTSRRITLANVPESEFAEWQRLGFTHIWLMGVWTSGPRSRAVALAVDDLQKAYGCSLQTVRHTDVAGSPYAIAEYRVPEAMGGDSGLEQFRAKLRQHGLKLLLDFVPNHVGLDHPWLKERPELFVQSATAAVGCFEQETNEGWRFIAHGRDPFFPPWSDTAQLDYRNPATREATLQELLCVA
ncbi:MAG TPA: alpha-amylase family glycosyl hydrolase, partial [Candidatus Paceibacterota bacterium]|nr:alpha-amylase family glycosyl hydrolase [Candidatus Paceibacterota bacterium]